MDLTGAPQARVMRPMKPAVCCVRWMRQIPAAYLHVAGAWCGGQHFHRQHPDRHRQPGPGAPRTASKRPAACKRQPVRWKSSPAPCAKVQTRPCRPTSWRHRLPKWRSAVARWRGGGPGGQHHGRDQHQQQKNCRHHRTIDGIAFQTNILALNAAVEAARAGGRAVCLPWWPAKWRSLARSAQAAKEIKTLIDVSVEKAETGAALVQNAGELHDRHREPGAPRVRHHWRDQPAASEQSQAWSTWP